MLYTNSLGKDKEYGYVYFIRFKEDFKKTKFHLGYDSVVNLGYGKCSVKIGSTHTKFRIRDIAQELYEHDLGIENIDIVRVIKCVDYRKLEKHIQDRFKQKKCKFKNEFFDLNNDDIFLNNYENFGYIEDTKQFNILYTQYKYFIKSINAISPNSILKQKYIELNMLFWGHF